MDKSAKVTYPENRPTGMSSQTARERVFSGFENRVGHFLLLPFGKTDFSENVFFVIWMPIRAHETNGASLAGTVGLNCEGTGTHASLKSQVSSLKSQSLLFS